MNERGASVPSAIEVERATPTAPENTGAPSRMPKSAPGSGGPWRATRRRLPRWSNAIRARFNLCYRMLGSPGEAEDAGQEVFLRAWTQLHTFQQDRRFSTWLLAIASHWCIDLLRRRRQTFVPFEGITLWATADTPDPEESALDSEQRDAVHALLQTLPPKYRLVTTLRYFQDLSYLEIAAMTGLSESAVKTQLHRARKMLADQLQKKGAPANVLQSIG